MKYNYCPLLESYLTLFLLHESYLTSFLVVADELIKVFSFIKLLSDSDLCLHFHRNRKHQ